MINPDERNYRPDYNFAIPRVIRIERDQLELEQFVYTLTQYNNFREGKFVFCQNLKFIQTDLNHFRQHDRLVSINGVQINSKTDVIINLAKLGCFLVRK